MSGKFFCEAHSLSLRGGRLGFNLRFFRHGGFLHGSELRLGGFLRRPQVIELRLGGFLRSSEFIREAHSLSLRGGRLGFNLRFIRLGGFLHGGELRLGGFLRRPQVIELRLGGFLRSSEFIREARSLSLRGGRLGVCGFNLRYIRLDSSSLDGGKFIREARSLSLRGGRLGVCGFNLRYIRLDSSSLDGGKFFREARSLSLRGGRPAASI